MTSAARQSVTLKQPERENAAATARSATAEASRITFMVGGAESKVSLRQDGRAARGFNGIGEAFGDDGHMAAS